MMRPRIFEITKNNEILGYGAVFHTGKCILEWTGPNQLLMIWETFNEMKLVSDIMKATIVFIET